MTGKCPYCEADLEVDKNVVVGQSVTCKYCERKFAYGVEMPKPKRIAVPQRKTEHMNDQAENHEVVCPHCNEKLMLNAKPVKGQSVKCPSCQRKFAYEPMFDYRSEIVPADIEFAIEAVLKNARQKSIYDGATDGARLFLGVLHYGRIFEHRIDLLKYWKLRDEVLSELKESDIRYVLQYESDKEVRDCLNKALRRVVSKETRPIQRPQIVNPANNKEEGLVDSKITNEPSTSPNCPIPPKVSEGHGNALFRWALAGFSVVTILVAVTCIFLISHQTQEPEQMIVQNPGMSREAVLLADKELESRIVEKMSEMQRKLDELQSICKRDMDDLEDRINDIEVSVKRDIGVRDKKMDENLSALTEKIRQLSENVGHGLSERLKSPENEVVLRKPEKVQPDRRPTETVADLQKKIEKNLLEIKRLRKENPACVLYPEANTKNIRNLTYKMCTNGDKRYCCREQITYVRHHFYCTGCDKEHDEGKCSSSRTSWPAWKAAYDNVAKTTEINKRIDDLREENVDLKKRILSFSK